MVIASSATMMVPISRKRGELQFIGVRYVSRKSGLDKREPAGYGPESRWAQWRIWASKSSLCNVHEGLKASHRGKVKGSE